MHCLLLRGLVRFVGGFLFNSFDLKSLTGLINLIEIVNVKFWQGRHAHLIAKLLSVALIVDLLLQVEATFFFVKTAIF